MNPLKEKQMRIHHSVCFVFAIAIPLFAGCSSPTYLPTTSPTTSSAATPTAAPTLTPSPTMQAISTATLLPPENILKYQPFEITTDLPSDVNPGGALVIWSEPPQLLHFYPQVRLETVSKIDNVGCLSTSPDGKWLAYCE